MFANEVPLLVSITFLIAILFPVFMIADLVRDTTKANKKFTIAFFYMCYFILVTIACFQGVFDVVSLPPRIIVTTTLPLLGFYLILIIPSPFYKNTLGEINLYKLIKVHIFRLIGGFFLILFTLDLLPKTFALIAGIGDIVTAITSLFVADAIQKRKKYAKSIALIWNTFGLLDILATSTTAVILTKLSMETGSMGVDVLTKFPFCLIPAFAPATIIFLHLSIYLKIFFKKFH